MRSGVVFSKVSISQTLCRAHDNIVRPDRLCEWSVDRQSQVIGRADRDDVANITERNQTLNVVSTVCPAVKNVQKKVYFRRRKNTDGERSIRHNSALGACAAERSARQS